MSVEPFSHRARETSECSDGQGRTTSIRHSQVQWHLNIVDRIAYEHSGGGRRAIEDPVGLAVRVQDNVGQLPAVPHV
eukprot:scaffold266193_cov40-Tisochrysis_lutea.AAC.2